MTKKEKEQKTENFVKSKLKSKSKDKELQNKVEELTEMLKRTQADFINYKTRVEKENKQLLEFAGADVVKKILPVRDSFELAIKNSQDPEKFKKGIEMVYAQLIDVLGQEGLRPINAKGTKFDPYKHEVLLKAKSDKGEDIVLEELQKGYMFKDKVLRHSKVKVSE